MPAWTPAPRRANCCHVVMLVMRTLAADMRRSPGALAPAQMGTLMKVAVGPCTMSALARHQAVSLPTISKSVDMLVRRGWLERWVDKHDRRQTMVRLTVEGPPRADGHQEAQPEARGPEPGGAHGAGAGTTGGGDAYALAGPGDTR